MTALIVFHSLFALFLVLVILLQPGKGDAGVGFGSSSQSIFGSRGAGNFLTKTTSVCAALFLLTSFLLTRNRVAEQNRSVIDTVPAPVESSAPSPSPAAEAPKKEGAPAPATK